MPPGWTTRRRILRSRFATPISLARSTEPITVSVTSEGAAHPIRITRADFYELLRQDSVMAVKLLWNFIQTLSSVIRMQNEEKNPVATQSRPDGFAHPYSREDDDEKQ